MEIFYLLAKVALNPEPTMNIFIKELALIIAAITGLISAIGVVINNIKTSETNKNINQSKTLIKTGNKLTKIGNNKTEDVAKSVDDKLFEKENIIKELVRHKNRLDLEKENLIKTIGEKETLIAQLRVERDNSIREAESAKSELMTRANIKVETDNLTKIKNAEFSVGSSDEVKTFNEEN